MLVATIKKFEVNTVLQEEITMQQLSYITGGMNASELRELSDGITVPKTRFLLFWENSCEQDWIRAITAFSLGVPLFLINLILVGWVKFYNHSGPAIAITVICACGVIIVFFSSHMKWGSFLFESSNKVKNNKN